MLKPLLTPLPVTKSPVLPSVRLTNPDFEYVPARATNVATTWKRFGWTPPRLPK